MHNLPNVLFSYILTFLNIEEIDTNVAILNHTYNKLDGEKLDVFLLSKSNKDKE